MKQTPFVGCLVCLWVLSPYKLVRHVVVHKAFALVPKDALSEKKEQGQMAGTLFTALGAIVELSSCSFLLQMKTLCMCVFLMFVWHRDQCLAHNKYLIC